MRAFNLYSLTRKNYTDILEISSERDLLEFGGVADKHALEISNFKHKFRFRGVIRIRDGVTSTKSLFEGYHSLNCQIVLPDSLISCESMFEHCYKYNFPVIIPESVENCNLMFKNCSTFNQPVILPPNVKYCNGMLSGCLSFNQPLVIPSSVISESGTRLMLSDCMNMKSPVLFKSDHSIKSISDCLRRNTALRPEQVLTVYGNYSELLLKSKLFIFG